MDQALLRTKKRRFLHQNLNALSSREKSCVLLRVAGVPIELSLSGPHQTENQVFLQKFYARFLASKATKPEIFVTYHSPSGTTAEPDHAFWARDGDPGFDFLDEKENTAVIQRDFFGSLHKTEPRIMAFGPRLATGATDSIDNLLNVILYRELPKHGAVPFHSATVVRNKKAYVFFGDSGAGKSTLAYLSHERNQLPIMSDDKVILKKEGDHLFAYAIPSVLGILSRDTINWEVGPVPVVGLFQLVRTAKKFQERPLTRNEFLPLFLRQIFYHPGFSGRAELLDLALEIAQTPSVICREIGYALSENPWNYIPEE